ISHSWPVRVTNTGALGQTIRVSGRTFGPAQNVQSGSLVLKDGSSPRFVGWNGVPTNYATFTFRVPRGADRLNASIAYPGNPKKVNVRVSLILVDPRGRFAAFSLPQGVANFGNVDVREPAQGIWTGVVFGAYRGINGSIPWRVSTQSFASFGRVVPSSLF